METLPLAQYLFHFPAARFNGEEQRSASGIVPPPPPPPRFYNPSWNWQRSATRTKKNRRERGTRDACIHATAPGSDFQFEGFHREALSFSLFPSFYLEEQQRTGHRGKKEKTQRKVDV